MLRKSPTTRRLVLANAALYLLTLLLPGPVYYLLSLRGFGSGEFFSYQLLTYQFVHATGPLHILMNMFMLAVFGSSVEARVGPSRMAWYYLISGVAGGLLHNITLPVLGQETTLVGASGSVWGILAMYALIRPNDPLYIFFLPVAVRAKWVISVFFAIEVASAFVLQDNVSHFAHIGGALAGVAAYYTNVRKSTL